MRKQIAHDPEAGPARRGAIASVLAWATKHPRVVTATVALLATVPFLIVALLRGSSPDLFAGASLVAAGVLLLWRARYPIVVVSLVALLASTTDPRLFTAAIAVALYEVARQRRLSVGILGYLIAVGVPLASTGVKIALGLHPGAASGETPPVGLGTSIIDPYVLIGLAAGIVIQNIQERRRAQSALLEQQLSHARAIERARITAEMHDIVGHALTVMVALANGARSGSTTDPERSAQALEHLTQVGATAMDDMQRTLRVLRDSDAELDESLHRSGHDLPPMEESIEVFRAAGLPVTLTQTGSPIPDDPLLITTMHRIVQEGLANALRYAVGATRVDVAIRHGHGLLTIDVTDDGTATRAPSVGTGRGLIGIAERAAAFNGTSAAGPRAPHGWQTRTILKTGRAS